MTGGDIKISGFWNFIKKMEVSSKREALLYTYAAALTMTMEPVVTALSYAYTTYGAQGQS